MSFKLSFHVLTHPDQLGSSDAWIAQTISFYSKSQEFYAQFIDAAEYFGDGWPAQVIDSQPCPRAFALSMDNGEDLPRRVSKDRFDKPLRYMYADQFLRVQPPMPGGPLDEAKMAFFRKLAEVDPDAAIVLFPS